MNHSQLRAFHAVATEGSFTRAAVALRVSQPTLSGHIKALEASYDVILFHRGSRDVVMSDLGRALFEITQRHFATQSEAQSLLSAAKGLIRGRLRVGADSPFGVIPLLAAYSGRYPKVRASVMLGNSKEIMGSLLSKKIDVGIVPKVKIDARLNMVPYREDNLVVFVDRGHAWSQRRSVKLAELSEQTLVAREPGSTTRAVVEAALTRHEIEPRQIIEIGSREAVKEAVAAGLGVGVVSESEFGHDTRLHKLTLSDVRLSVVECVVCRSEQARDPAVAAFLAIAKSDAETAR